MPLPPNVAAALAQGGSQAAGGLVNTLFGWIGAKKKYKRERRAWRQTNKYNSPEEQRKRYEAAGINPHFALTGGGQGGIAGPAPSQESTPPEVNTPDILGKMMQYASVKQSQTQTDSLKTSIELLNEKIDALGLENQLERERSPYYEQKAYEESIYSGQKNVKQAAEFQLKKAQKDKLVREGVNQLEILKQSASLKKWQAKFAEIQTKWAENNIRPGDPALVKEIRMFLARNPELAAPIQAWIKRMILRLTGVKTK